MAVVFPLCTSAETRYVSPDGAHIPPFSTWADAATNIQAAIDFCAPSDVVVVTNGVYLLNATVRVTNDVTLASPNGRDTVLLDGSALPPGADAVFLQFGTLDGLTVSNAPRHGVKSEYGAILNSLITHSGQSGIDSYTTPRIVTNSTLIVTNTIVAISGSNGIYTCAVDTRILGCVISGSAGTGVSLRQNDTVSPMTLPRVSNFLIQASTVSSNLNSGIMVGFWNYSASLPRVPVYIEDCLIEDNVGINGGGIADGDGSSTDKSSGTQIVGCVIQRNKAAQYAGGIFLQASRQPSIFRSSIVSNNATLDGGGLILYSGRIYDSLIKNNSCGRNGGGAAINYYDPSGSGSRRR